MSFYIDQLAGSFNCRLITELCTITVIATMKLNVVSRCLQIAFFHLFLLKQKKIYQTFIDQSFFCMLFCFIRWSVTMLKLLKSLAGLKI